MEVAFTKASTIHHCLEANQSLHLRVQGDKVRAPEQQLGSMMLISFIDIKTPRSNGKDGKNRAASV